MPKSQVPSSAGQIVPRRKPSPLRPASQFTHVVVMIGIAIVLMVAFGFVVWLLVGHPNLSAPTPTAPGRADTPGPPSAGLTVAERLDMLKVILAVVGGTGAIVALTVAYRKQREGEIADYREETKTFADRFGKAVDQLGGSQPAVRVGGAYAMAELADEWEGGRQMCVDVLCAYLRLPYQPDPTEPDFVPGNKEVRRIILRIIRNHLRPDWSAVRWTGLRFSFEGAVFDCGDLSKAAFVGGNVTLHNARFVGGHFEFDGTEFATGSTWFGKVHFEGGLVTFTNANFDGSTVSFANANFTGSDVVFDGARIAGNLSFKGSSHTAGQVMFNNLVLGPNSQIDWGPFPTPGPADPPTGP
jgi:hypothetical protein